VHSTLFPPTSPHGCPAATTESTATHVPFAQRRPGAHGRAASHAAPASAAVTHVIIPEHERPAPHCLVAVHGSPSCGTDAHAPHAEVECPQKLVVHCPAAEQPAPMAAAPVFAAQSVGGLAPVRKSPHAQPSISLAQASDAAGVLAFPGAASALVQFDFSRASHVAASP
jgi:hypothetical protein